MKTILLTASCFSFLLLVSSCNTDNKQTEDATATTETTEETGTPVVGGDSTLTNDQKELFEHVAKYNQLQIELGRLAAERGKSDAVKQYGQQMNQQYTEKRKELSEMATLYGITLGDAIDQDYRDDVDDVTKAKPEKFDEEYWDNVTDAQEDLLEDYNDVLKDIPETDATAFYTWARTSMQELRAQMEQAMAHEKQLKSGQM